MAKKTDNQERTIFNTSDRIRYMLEKTPGEKGKVAELIKTLGFNHPSQYYTRRDSNSWTLDEVLTICKWWGISISEFVGGDDVQNSRHPLYIEQRVEQLEKQVSELTQKK